MYEVKTDGVIKEYSDKDFLMKFGLEDKKDFFKPPFTNHVLVNGDKTINVTLKEN